MVETIKMESSAHPDWLLVTRAPLSHMPHFALSAVFEACELWLKIRIGKQQCLVEGKGKIHHVTRDLGLQSQSKHHVLKSAGGLIIMLEYVHLERRKSEGKAIHRNGKRA